MNDDRAAHRAAVEAGYASLPGYIEKWGDAPAERCTYRRKAWLWIIAGTVAFWGLVAWAVLG